MYGISGYKRKELNGNRDNYTFVLFTINLYGDKREKVSNGGPYRTRWRTTGTKVWPASVKEKRSLGRFILSADVKVDVKRKEDEDWINLEFILYQIARNGQL